MHLVMAQTDGTYEPTYSSWKKMVGGPVTKMNPRVTPLDKEHPRYGNRFNDLYKVMGLLAAKRDVFVAMDADMKIVSEEFKHIEALTMQFGLCLPANPRHLVKVDGVIGKDGDYKVGEDKTGGCGYAYNMSPIAFYGKHKEARRVLEKYVEEMCERPRRGPLAMWRAVWKVGFAPYVLPVNWCVCRENIGMGYEICLHTGHKEVGELYSGGHCPRCGDTDDWDRKYDYGMGETASCSDCGYPGSWRHPQRGRHQRIGSEHDS